MVSAWPEPPSAIPAEPSAGAITERKCATSAPGPLDRDARDATVTKVWD
jgi:hypothetical protein